LSHKSLPATAFGNISEAVATNEVYDNLLISWAMVSTDFSPSDSTYSFTWSGASQSRPKKEPTDELQSKRASFTTFNAFWGSGKNRLLWTTFLLLYRFKSHRLHSMSY